MKFLALDYETSNQHNSSICATGYALFENTDLINKGHFYSRPEPFQFDEHNVAVNGISRFMVADEPLYKEKHHIISELDFDFIVSHNAKFDMQCLYDVCELQSIEITHTPFLCTMIMASRFLRSRFLSLDRLCALSQIELNHHAPESDAMACGYLFLYLLKVSKCTLPEFLKEHGITPGSINGTELVDVDYEKRKNPYHGDAPINVSKMNLHLCKPINDRLKGKTFVFTGFMDQLSRTEAAIEVTRRGGGCANSTVLKTTYLVVGNSSYKEYLEGTYSTKISRALELNETKGKNIQILTEDEFLKILNE